MKALRPLKELLSAGAGATGEGSRPASGTCGGGDGSGPDFFFFPQSGLNREKR